MMGVIPIVELNPVGHATILQVPVLLDVVMDSSNLVSHAMTPILSAVMAVHPPAQLKMAFLAFTMHNKLNQFALQSVKMANSEGTILTVYDF